MKNYILILSLGVMMILSFGCTKQELFVDEIGTPVFTADVPLVNGDELNIIAGDEEYYMYASILDNQDGTIHRGHFGKVESCTESCEESLAINIHNKSNFDDFDLGEYEYYTQPKDGYKHDYALISNEFEDYSKASWRVENQVYEGASLTVNSDEIPNSIGRIELTYKESNQFLAIFKRDILPKSIQCDLTLEIIRNPAQGIFLKLKTSSNQMHINWSTGDTGPIIKVDLTQQTYTAVIIDGAGCTTQIYVKLLSPNLTENYKVGFSQDSNAFTSDENKDLSVSIEYTDPTGTFYSSGLIGQILPFSFKVLAIEEYDKNEINLSTKKISASFDCILFGDNGKTIRIKDAEATFAIGY